MAFTRVSPGMYKNNATGEIVRSASNPGSPQGGAATPAVAEPAYVQPTGDENHNAQLFQQLQNMFQGDNALLQGLQPAMGIAGMGAPTMSPEAGFFNFGALGRVDEELHPDVQMALDLRRERLDGYTPQEMQAFREQALPQMDNELNSALRAARIGSLNNNVFGGMSQAAMPGIMRGAQDATRGLERDIFLSNIAERNNRLNSFEGSAVGAQNELLNRHTFNLNQLAGEKSGQLGLLFGTLGLAGQREGSSQAFDLAKEQLAIARQQAAQRPAAPSTTYNIQQAPAGGQPSSQWGAS